MPFAEQIHAAGRDQMAGEAAVAVACHARGKADAALLLEALGLEQAAYRWSAARVAAAVLCRSRFGVEFSSNTVKTLVPGRAWHLIPAACRDLVAAGLAAPTGDTVRSTSPGANRRRVPVYRLTIAGEYLSRDVDPLPGMTAHHPLAELC